MKNSATASLFVFCLMSPLSRGELVASYDALEETSELKLGSNNWSDHAKIPTPVTASDTLTRDGGKGVLTFSGWGTTIDTNKRVSFRVTAKPGYRLNLSELVHFNSGGGRQTANALSSFVWGYRIDENNDGIFEGNWVFGKTYTPANGDVFKESESFKDWDFADFTTRGTVEFAIFATAPTPAGSLLVFGDKIALNGAPALPVGALDSYPYAASYNIPVSEASGVSYNRDTGTLFAIGDEGMELVELSKTGTKLSAMPFDQNGVREVRALDDPEGVSYLGGGKFAISDERRNMAVVVTYDPTTTPNHDQLAATSYAFGAYDGNTGLEGIAYDPISQSLWGIKETGPVRVYEMPHFPEVRGGAAVTVRDPLLRKRITRAGIIQLSDIYVMAESAWFSPTDPRRKDILLLSRDGRRIFEINRDGRVVGSRDLNFLGRSTIEGMTMDDDGNIYLVSEQVNGSFSPQLHVFNPGTPAPTYTPDQVLAFDTYSKALGELDLTPTLALSSPSLVTAIDNTRARGRSDVTENPGDYHLFSESSIQDLRGRGIMVRATGDEVNLKMPVEKSSTLDAGSWTDAGFQLETTVPKTEGKEFYRLAIPQ
jgi:uncharacterized protein YjiK